MNYVIIDNIRPWDGRYEFDLDDQELTTREWSWIKRFSGYLPMTLQAGLEGADPELFCAIAVIALWRADKIQPAEAPQIYDRLIDAPFGSTIQLEAGEEPAEEGDAGPPAPGSSGSSSINGDGSRTSSETSDETPDPTGTPASATSVSAPPTSVT